MPMPSAHRRVTPLIALLAWTAIQISCTMLDSQANPTAAAQVQLPAQCETDCVTPYGQVLGVAPGNVPAYSNCNAKCVVFVPHKEHGTYTGIQWQCVEFARRWLLANHGVVYGDVDTAADIWKKIQFVTRLADSKTFPLRAHLNGSTEPPQVGDLLIYVKEYLNTGHVAVVTEVDLKAGIIKVAEQNFLNQQWHANYARQIALLHKDGKYWLLDAYLLGWKRVVS